MQGGLQAKCAYPLARSAWGLPGGEASCTVTNQDPFVGGQAEAALQVITMFQVFLAGTEWLVRFPKSRYPAERPGDCLECPVSAVLTALGQLSWPPAASHEHAESGVHLCPGGALGTPRLSHPPLL